MSDTIEHRVEMFRLARERQEAGLPVWDRRVSVKDIFADESRTFTERRDAICARLRASSWLRGRDMFDPVIEAVDGLEGADDEDEFDGWWDEIYDYADVDRVWIETR